MPSERELIVEESRGQQRLDKYLAQSLGLSRTELSRCLGAGLVLSPQGLKPSSLVRPGQSLLIDTDLLPVEEPPFDLETSELGLDDFPVHVLYEDQDILVVSKGRDLVVQDGVHQDPRTLVNWLKIYLNRTVSAGEKGREGLVHRLDQATTGALVLAKTERAYQDLKGQFMARSVRREYLGICHGTPSSPRGQIRYPLARHPRRRQTFYCSPEGREAVSNFQILATTGSFSLLRLGLVTGRTHQIRVHLKEIGCPLLGDPIYGREDASPFLALHAQVLGLRLLSGEEKLFICPLPDDWSDLLSSLWPESCLDLSPEAKSPF